MDSLSRYGYDANGNMTSRNGSTISWSSFNLPTVIHRSGSNSSQFFYTPDRARYKQVANYAGTTETTIYVGGLLEKLTRGALTEFRHLIQAGQEHTVIYTRRSNGTTDTFHVTRDHLGSAAAITDASGNVLVQESFTAFGARRGANWAGSPSSADWTQIANTTRRGFTDHEHLDNLNLIHMNGRVYDPGLGRFISADPFIDGWTTTQGYNRYSYVHNNPLRFIDPSGFRKRNPEERNESEGSGGGGHLNPGGKPMEEMVVKEPRPNWSQYIFTDVPGGGEHVNPNGKPMEEIRVTAPRYGYQGVGRTSYSSYSTFGPENTVPQVAEGIAAGSGVQIVSHGIAVGELAAGWVLYSNVYNGQWRGMNGNWYRMGWGGNQWTGARSSAIERANRFRAAGTAFFAVNSSLSGINGVRAASNGDGFGFARSAVDLGWGVAGTLGGKIGLAGATSYMLTTVLISIPSVYSSTVTPIVDLLCSTSGC